MAHVQAPNLRGKGVSETKFTKAGEPKRSGNWSYSTIHYQNMQSKDYNVREITYENGIRRLVVGDNNTPLAQIMGETINTLALNDEYFDCYARKGYKTVNGKQYEAQMILRKVNSQIYSYDKHKFVYREMIYTDGDFDYNFPEY